MSTTYRSLASHQFEPHSPPNSSIDVFTETTSCVTNWGELTLISLYIQIRSFLLSICWYLQIRLPYQVISSVIKLSHFLSLLISYHDSEIINCIIRCNVWFVFSQSHHSKSSKFWSRIISIRLRNFHRCWDILLQWHWSWQDRSSHTQQICDLSSILICSSRHRGLWSVNLYTDRFRIIHRESSQTAERITVKNPAWLLLLSRILS
jgi:hypothetical protein